MRTRKIYLLLILTLLIISSFLINKDVIFQEGNPIPILKGMIQLNDTNTFIKVSDNPITYITKTNHKEGLFNYIENEYDVVFKEQMGSGYMFEGTENSVILTSRQYSRFYQIWQCSERSIMMENY